MVTNLRQLVARSNANSGPDLATIAALTEQLNQWCTTIGSLLEETTRMTRTGPGPQAELDYWMARSTTLTALNEQLNGNLVKEAVAVLRANKAPELETFDFNLAQLNKLRAESKDNVRFLSTLERHFKHLAQCPTFLQATEHMGALMNALRMVWVISRHFNTDERMVALMERIAWLLQHRVARQISPRNLLKKSLPEALELCNEGIKMLQSWEEAYIATRDTIEKHGRDARWEFDRQRLFRQTNFTVKILEDLRSIVDVTQEFHNIFGSELKRVTGNPEVRIQTLNAE
jgi:dynein heavy chain